jgi:glycosyltransferase involved in cell wall biosynthesis
MLSIVTATYNCAAQLPTLIASLRRQTDREFEWVVMDGASSDGTLQLLQAITDFTVVISSQPDFGIYDAINRGLKTARGDYYVIAGADDAFASDAVARFRGVIAASGEDILAARVTSGPHLFKVKRGPSWFFGERSFIGNHSVGTAFRRSLHDCFGFYSRRLTIAADSLFVLQACRGGATRRELEFVAGDIGPKGVSAMDWAGSATELFRAQLMTGGSVAVQTLVLLLRIVKGASTNARAIHDALFR